MAGVFPKLRLRSSGSRRSRQNVNGCYRLLTFQSTRPLTSVDDRLQSRAKSVDKRGSALTARKCHKTQPPPGAKPFASALWPYLALITYRRLKRATWSEIAEEISAADAPVTRQGVHVFFKRCKQREKRRGSSYALGTEPTDAGFRVRLEAETSQQKRSSDASVQAMTVIDEIDRTCSRNHSYC